MSLQEEGMVVAMGFGSMRVRWRIDEDEDWNWRADELFARRSRRSVLRSGVWWNYVGMGKLGSSSAYGSGS